MKFLSWFNVLKWSPPRILVCGFAVIIAVGALLLSQSFVSATGERLPFIDALFTSASAMTVTGLVLVDTGTYFNGIGQSILLVLIQFGGLGFMTMATLLALVLRRRITLKERLILAEAFNLNSTEGIVRLIRRVVLYSLSIEVIGMLLFTIRFSYDMPFAKALYFGLFHSISLFNNAGFDIFGEFRSFTAYAADPVITITSVLLIISGGLGFIVLSDLIDYRKNKKLSLHSKVVLTMSGSLIAVGMLVILVFEFTNMKTLGSLDFGGKLWASLYQSVTPRTGGANTIDYTQLRQATTFFTILLMFIGASPGSTGGGIKTTTFAILLGSVFALLRGQEDVVMFRYRLAKERVYKALTITLLSIGLIIIVTISLSIIENKPFLMTMFEATSAFANVGLSIGLTLQLSDVGKIIIIMTMFIGRVGLLTLAYGLGNGKSEKRLFRYPEGKITIG